MTEEQQRLQWLREYAVGVRAGGLTQIAADLLTLIDTPIEELEQY